MNLKNMTEQFEKSTIETLFKNKISIRGLFILEDNRYLYQIFNNCKEEWYMISENSFLKLDIIKQASNMKVRKLFFAVGDNKYISLKEYYNVNERGQDNIYIKLHKNGEKYYSISDTYLNEMFIDIYRMKT